MRNSFFRRLPRRLSALGMAAVCVVSAGCGSLGDTSGGSGSAATSVEIQEFQRSNLAYQDMTYEYYDQAKFTPFASAISAFAQAGGEQEDFDAACKAAEDELNTIYTLSLLMDLKSSAAPSDQTVASEDLYIEDVYDIANDEYWTAMHAVATSDYAELLDANYSSWQQDWFQDYDSDSAEEEQDLTSRESELEKQYEALISADEVDYDAVCDVFVQLVQLRQQLAEQYGYDTYADYAYDSVFVRNYKPADVEALWDAARQSFIPLIAQYADQIYDRTNTLYTGDDIDCTPEAILDAMDGAVGQMAPEIYQGFQYMRQYGLYDIAPDDQKLNTGYTTYFYAYREPFIFNAASGSYYDYTDLFHEFGHYTNYFFCGSDLLFGAPDYDLSELQSQGMEVMFFPYYDQIFGSDNGKDIRSSVLLNLMYSVTDGAMYDEFLQKVYREKHLTSQRVRDIYQEVYESYGYELYDGFQEEWMDTVHNFEEPFYYISYAVSAVSALELFVKQLEDQDAAMETYLEIAAMDTEGTYFTEALKRVGLSDVFSDGTCQQIAKALGRSGAL